MFKKVLITLMALTCAALPMRSMAATTPAVNLVANPSMETVSGNTATGWTDGTWSTASNTVYTATVENTGHTGTHSLKTAVTGYTDGDAKWVFDSVAVTPGASYAYSNWYKSDVASEIDVQVNYATGDPTYDRLVGLAASPSAWSQASATYIAPANAISMTVYQTIASVGYTQIDDVVFGAYTPTKFTRPMVSLTFDDGWLDQYTNGLPILDKYGMKSTFYLLTSTLDHATYPDYMTEDNFKALLTDGQEIASHTVTHADLATLDQTQIDQELSNAQLVLQNLVNTVNPALKVQNFATPLGSYNDLVLAEIKKYYRSHRSTDVGYNSKDNFDIYNIKVQNILDSTTPAEVAGWVNQAKTDGTWLVLVYHLVDNDPVPTAGTEDYSVTPANLDAELANMKASGIAVLTVNQALDEIVAQLGLPTNPTTKPGDVNGDNKIDIFDLSILSTNWLKPTGATLAQGDLNNDGKVDIFDLSILSTNWSK